MEPKAIDLVSVSFYERVESRRVAALGQGDELAIGSIDVVGGFAQVPRLI